MKKLLAIILIIVLALPAAALADYSSKLGMTMDEYLVKYNSIAAPLGCPYQKLVNPYQWTRFGGYNVAWFKPVKNSSVVMLLLTMDPMNEKNLSSGLDMIQICTDNSKDFIDLISITGRAAEPFAAALLGTSLSDMRVAQVIRYYYENGYKGSGGYAYWSIDEAEKLVLAFFESKDWYYFSICTPEDM